MTQSFKPLPLPQSNYNYNYIDANEFQNSTFYDHTSVKSWKSNDSPPTVKNKESTIYSSNNVLAVDDSDSVNNEIDDHIYESPTFVRKRKSLSNSCISNHQEPQYSTRSHSLHNYNARVSEESHKRKAHSRNSSKGNGVVNNIFARIREKDESEYSSSANYCSGVLGHEHLVALFGLSSKQFEAVSLLLGSDKYNSKDSKLSMFQNLIHFHSDSVSNQNKEIEQLKKQLEKEKQKQLATERKLLDQQTLLENLQQVHQEDQEMLHGHIEELEEKIEEQHEQLQIHQQLQQFLQQQGQASEIVKVSDLNTQDSAQMQPQEQAPVLTQPQPRSKVRPQPAVRPKPRGSVNKSSTDSIHSSKLVNTPLYSENNQGNFDDLYKETMKKLQAVCMN
eukprot:Pgem_evm1s831